MSISAKSQRHHREIFLRGCSCDWCEKFRELGREAGRRGAAIQLELARRGVWGACGCGEPLQAGARLCAYCRQPLSRIGYANCVICNKLFVSRGVRERKTCGHYKCQRDYRAIKVRNREHMRRASVSDITPEQEMAMRKRARKCPRCGVYMTSKPHLPNSKHLDHILPVSQGGTHTHGNVRIICATCNLSRPKDGSDFTGQLTLWAQGPAMVSRPRRHGGGAFNGETCRKGLHPWIPANIVIRHDGKLRCRACQQASLEQRGKYRPQKQCKCGAMFAARGNQFMCFACIETAGRKAAELHASGLTWEQVAREIGYGSHNGEGARYAAERIGYKPAPRPPKPKSPRLCSDCGTPLAKYEHCRTCTAVTARRAVHLRQHEGWTLRMIADELGYASITTVTNLMKTVITIDSQMGRPRKAKGAPQSEGCPR